MPWPSVEYIEQAQEVLRVAKNSLTRVYRSRQTIVKWFRTVTTQDQSQKAKRDDSNLWKKSSEMFWKPNSRIEARHHQPAERSRLHTHTQSRFPLPSTDISVRPWLLFPVVPGGTFATLERRYCDILIEHRTIDKIEISSHTSLHFSRYSIGGAWKLYGLSIVRIFKIKIWAQRTEEMTVPIAHCGWAYYGITHCGISNNNHPTHNKYIYL